MKITLALATLVLTACGASKPSNKSSASRSTPSTPTTSTYKLAECSRFNASTIATEGYFSTYYDSGTGKIRYDFINLQLTAIPNEVANQTTYGLQFMRWSENVAGQRVTNTLPTKFMVIDRLTGQMVFPNTIEKINKTMIDNSIKTFGSNTTVTGNNFVNRVQFVLTGVDFTYDGISVALVNSTNAVVAKADYLIPPFYADPNIYSSQISVSTLHSLHPYYNLRSSGGRESDFLQMANDVCSEMVSGTRVPASVDPKSEQNIFVRIITWIKNLF